METIAAGLKKSDTEPQTDKIIELGQASYETKGGPAGLFPEGGFTWYGGN